MRLITLPTVWTVLLDALAWGIIQTLISWMAMHFPERWIHPNRGFYQTFKFEEDGRIYQNLFRVKNWKGRLPYGGSLFQDEFTMRTLGAVSEAHIHRWLKETCRSELSHWLAILPAGLFFLWNEWWVGLIMIVYALSFNLPLIITQRFNRPRLRKMLAIFLRRTRQPNA